MLINIQKLNHWDNFLLKRREQKKRPKNPDLFDLQPAAHILAKENVFIFNQENLGRGERSEQAFM